MNCTPLLRAFGAIAALILLSNTAAGQPRIPPKYHADVKYVIRLPKYCYFQYVDGALGGYQYSIPKESCGPYTNHFCGGLVLMMQAQDIALPKSQRVEAARMAVTEINYLPDHGMKPGCFIANDVKRAQQEINMVRQIVR